LAPTISPRAVISWRRLLRDEIASRVELLIGELEQEDADGDR